MKINAVKGTKDYLPSQAQLREYIERTIMSVYRENGFERIMTPALEAIENLDKSDGGDNLNLIYRILKRGDKLNKALQSNGNLADLGLRYDLTLPLARYYSCNRQKLILPFKCIQVDKVYRAERPQKGRAREFMQCDIDVIGNTSSDCEIELIMVTAKALTELNIGEFVIRINDRQLLNRMLIKLGFEEKQLSSVCVTFDKLDKIGADGVANELISKGYSQNATENLMEVLSELPLNLDKVSQIIGDDEVAQGLAKIIIDSNKLSGGKYKVVFDISLVRGQGYYTGTVFEVQSKEFGGTVAGGGRYDNLIGRFTSENIAACGFSIGFERIYSILCDRNIPACSKDKIAMIYEGDYAVAYEKSSQLRGEFDVSLYRKPKKLKGFLDKLSEGGYAGFCFADTLQLNRFVK